MSETSSSPTSFLERLRSGTVYKRFLIAAITVGLGTSLVAMAVAWRIGRDMALAMHEDASYTLLRNVQDLIGRTKMSMDEMRGFYIRERKESLRSACAHVTSMLDGLLARAPKDGEQIAVLKAQALDQIRNLSASGAAPMGAAMEESMVVGAAVDASLLVIDADRRLVVYPDKELLGKSVEQLQSADGDFMFRKLVRAAREAPAGTAVFDVYFLKTTPASRPLARLVAAQYSPSWDMVVGAEMDLGDIDQTLADKNKAALEDLRARVGEIVVGRTGYVIIFNKDCAMIAHPTLVDEDFASIKLPGASISMCEAIKNVAEQPWGLNKMRYDWDRPEDKGSYHYPKMFWGAREPTTGWYTLVTVYLSEIEEKLPGLMLTIFLPAFGSILFLAGTLAFLLRGFLKPVQELTEVCRQVGRGDLTVRAPNDVRGEIGFLCRQFNKMVMRIAALRLKDESQRAKLEELNKNLEKIVRLRTQALERKARKLEDANLRLKELDEMKSGFLSSVSHELRTPLTSILGFAKLIRKDIDKHLVPGPADPPERAHKIERINANVSVIVSESERLTRLINDFLDLAKITAGRVEWRDAPVSLEEVVMASFTAIAALFKEKPEVSLVAHITPDLPFLYADRDRLVQVLVNLLSNAFKFTTTGSVTVSACARENHIQVRIRDTGVGMSRESLLKIFDRFYQAHHNDIVAVKPTGTGLGLAICHNILTRYHGLIWAESEPGKGATIVFELPAEPEYVLAQSSLVSSQQPGDRAVDAPKPHILVVDDDPATRDLLSQIFTGEGYSVETAEDGQEALDKAHQLKPELITMDVMMPVLDGKAAIAALKADAVTAHIPILVLTVLPDAQAAGADAALTKPFDADILLDTVACLLKRAESRRPLLILRRAGQAKPTAHFLLFTGEAHFCDEHEFWGKIEADFKGVAIIPARAINEFDLTRLLSHPNVHTLLLPEEKPAN